MDFANVGAQLGYWLNNIGQEFKGGWDGSGENGVDIGMPVGTPVYAVEDGDVKGHGYYEGGGVVSIRKQPGKVWYYQHLDLVAPDIESGKTTHVQAGQLIGYSGGQTGYGRHPVSSLKYSNDGHGHGWPHIEVGINAPWGGIWGGGEGANVDPQPYLRQLAQTGGAATTGTPVGTQYASSTSSDPCGPFPVNPIDWGQWFLCKASGGIGGNPGGGPNPGGGSAGGDKVLGWMGQWLADPLRLVKVIGGVLLLIGGFLLFVIPAAAPAALEVGGLATGQPEVAAAGAAIQKGKSTRERAKAGARIYRQRQQKQQQKGASDGR